MSQCPVCSTEYPEGEVKNCSVCGWDLTPYPIMFAGQLPEDFLAKERAKLAWAKEMWVTLQQAKSVIEQVNEEKEQLQSEINSQREEGRKIAPEQIFSELSELKSQLSQVQVKLQQKNHQLETVKYQGLACIYTFDGHSESVKCIASSDDKRTIASLSNDGIIKIWDLVTGEVSHTINEHTTYKDRINSISFNQHPASLGEELVAITETNKFLVYKSQEWIPSQVKRNWRIDKIVGFHPDTPRSRISQYKNKFGNEFIVLVQGETIIIQKKSSNSDSWELLQTLKSHPDQIKSIDVNNEIIASLSNHHVHEPEYKMSSTINIWHLETGEIKDHLFMDNCYVRSLTLNPENSYLAIPMVSGIKIWHFGSSKELQLIKEKDVEIIAISSDGKTIASGSSYGTVRLWNLEDERLLCTLYAHKGEINCLTFTPDNQYLISGSEDTTIKVWAMPVSTDWE